MRSPSNVTHAIHRQASCRASTGKKSMSPRPCWRKWSRRYPRGPLGSLATKRSGCLLLAEAGPSVGCFFPARMQRAGRAEHDHG